MAKILDVKLSKVKTGEQAEIVVRVYVSRLFSPQFRTGLYIDPTRFLQPERTATRCATYVIDIPRKGKLNYPEVKALEETRRKLSLFLERIVRVCNTTAERHSDLLTADWIGHALELINKNDSKTEDICFEHIQSLIDQENQQKEIKEEAAERKGFFELLDSFVSCNPSSRSQEKGVHVLMRALARYERFIQSSDKERSSFIWDIDTTTKDDIEDFRDYFRNEKALSEQYPRLFKTLLSDYPATINVKRKSPQALEERGNNTIVILMKKFKAFWNWCLKTGETTNNPFYGIEIGTEKYGQPIYISLDERNRIADFDLSEHPQLEVQRDVFIFQCCVGCRVSDLIRMTPSNVIDGVLEYIPTKTKTEKPMVVRVPLNSRAADIVKRYRGVDKGGMLLPFLTAQRYNDNIKEVFRKCGIDRLVTIVDSVTGDEVQVPICDVASSHMARRTFVGCLYKQVKDPNLIASMSGHVEGSKAFNRYRAIDDDVKRETIKLID